MTFVQNVYKTKEVRANVIRTNALGMKVAALTFKLNEAIKCFEVFSNLANAGNLKFPRICFIAFANFH
jgi:hypothetical protein